MTPICLEIALRILGYTPFMQTQYYISSKPNMCLGESPDLGFALREGVFKVSVNGAPEYTATHKDGQRITRTDSPGDSLLDVFIMGCSFTYGMGVDDSVSFPYQIQSHFPELDVQNFGVPAFGTVQSYLQLVKEIEEGNIPELVIVNFCDFHHERNSLTPEFRNSLAIGYERSNKEVASKLKKSTFPYIENSELTTTDYNDLYSNWIGRETFASVNYFQSQKDDRLRVEIDVEQNSSAVFWGIKKICEKYSVQLAVTGLTQTEATDYFLGRLVNSGIHTMDISVDLQSEKYNLMPYDSHPNKKAHDHYAKELIHKIELWISSLSSAS